MEVERLINTKLFQASPRYFLKNAFYIICREDRLLLPTTTTKIPESHIQLFGGKISLLNFKSQFSCHVIILIIPVTTVLYRTVTPFIKTAS